MMTTTRTRPGEGPRVLLLRATARAAGFVTGQVSEPGPGPLRPPNPRGQRRESSAGAVGQVRASSHPWPGPADAVMTHDLPPWGALPPGIWGRRSCPATSELHRVTGRDCPARPAPGGPRLAVSREESSPRQRLPPPRPRQDGNTQECSSPRKSTSVPHTRRCCGSPHGDAKAAGPGLSSRKCRAASHRIWPRAAAGCARP